MINLIVTGRTSTALNELIQARLDAAFGHFEKWIERVEVRLWDANGPKHGRDDQHCRMTVRLHGAMQVLVEEVGDDPYAIVVRATDRAKQTVARKITKRRSQKSFTLGRPLAWLPKLA